MAQSFWSKRKESLNTAGGYIKAADSVSRPTAVIMTLLGILVVGGLLFGIFSGTRWAYSKLTDTSSSDTASNGTTNTTVTSPTITATSSTSTTTPSATTSTPSTAPASTTTTTVASSATTAPATSSTGIPKTGASSNLGLFVAIATLSYLIYRKKLLSSRR